MKCKTKKRDSFVFYRSFYEAIKELDDDAELEMFEAICEYSLNQRKPLLENSLSNSLFTLIKPQLDANYRKYKNACKGGVPKGTINNPKGNNQYTSIIDELKNAKISIQGEINKESETEEVKQYD